MRCHEIDPWIDAIAGGDDVAPDLLAHVAACPRCQIALANARAIDAALRDREQPSVPAGFTPGVMTRIRRERWRSEQILDWSFNAAVAIGIALIVTGVTGLAWATGLISIGGDMMTLLRAGSDLLAERLVRESPTIALAGLLLTMTLGVWWWVQTDVTI